MMILHGKWYDGRTSIQVDAVLTLHANGRAVLNRADNGGHLQEQPFSAIRVTPRLADTPRFLNFSEGGTFETRDNAGVDEALARFGRWHWSRWVHRLETRLRFIIPAVAGFIFLMIALVQFGVPVAAKLIAARLPAAAYQMAGDQTLDILDRMVFKPSGLPPEVELRLRRHLQQVIDAHHGIDLQILFRKGGKIGPNAFALPDATIIFTDEMVDIARHDDEILAVLAHEIGHVVHHHAMRRVVQDSLLSFTVLAITGDASGVSELFLGMPVLLTELAYSRAFEREADQYALAWLRANHIPTRRFSDLISRIDRQEKDMGKHGDARWTGYLSTHPSTRERMAAFGGSQGNP